MHFDVLLPFTREEIVELVMASLFISSIKLEFLTIVVITSLTLVFSHCILLYF